MPAHLTTRLLCLAIIGCCLSAVAGAAEHWPRFRGPNGTGLATAELPASWQQEHEAWRVPLPGMGHSSPIVWDQLVVVTSAVDHEKSPTERLVVGLDLRTGRTLWTHQEEGPAFAKHKLNSSASSTPVADEHSVYICWPTPARLDVVALDHAGQFRWRRALDGYRASHGGGTSPIVYDDLVIVSNEHQGASAIVALEKESGRIRWQTGRKSKATWSTPCLREVAGQPPELICVSWEHGITALSPEDGRVLWEADVFDRGHTESSIASPVLFGDLVLGASGYLGVRQEVVALRPPSQRVYTLDRNVPLCTTPLVVNGLLFLWSDEGITSCIDAASGKLHWRKRIGGNYYASPIASGGKVYNISADGDVVVLAAAKEYELLGRTSLNETCHATAAVAGGTLLLRTVGHLLAVRP